MRWSRPCEPIENDPIAEVEPSHVVVDASLLAGALIDAEGPIGHRYRHRLSELVDVDQAYVLRTLTKLEVAAALRNQLQRAQRGHDGSGSITPGDCERVIKGMAGWPFARIDLTQPMLIRIWELRANVSPYDAMYVAATEQLLASHDGQAMLATADKRLAGVPNLSIPVELFDPAAT